MGLVEQRMLVARLSPPFDHMLTTMLISEFVSMEQRFIQRDWEPAELDGGQYCEVLARILYHIDSTNLNYTKSFDDCIKYLEQDQNSHVITPRHDALHLARVLRTAYKFRSQRGAVHISPSYSPNHMDAKFLIESVRWCMNEILRIYWNGDRESVARAIREILQFDVPCIGVFDDIIMVQRTDLKADEEILVLLHYAGEQGFSRTDIGVHVKRAAPTITQSLQKLISPVIREVVRVGTGNYRLTDLGAKRVREQLADKLLVQ